MGGVSTASTRESLEVQTSKSRRACELIGGVVSSVCIFYAGLIIIWAEPA